MAKNYKTEQIKNEFEDFISKGDVFSRSNPIGHITGSCWILDETKKKVLLTHHKKLKIWIPTGGHSEGEVDPYLIALREGEEETGLKLKPLSNKPFFTDIHIIPDYNGVKSHKHFDYTYIFVPTDNRNFIISSESLNLKWIELDKLEQYTKEDNVLIMRDRTLEMVWNIETIMY